MFLEIITPDKKLYSGEATYIKLPGKDGSFGVMKNHAALISTLKVGTIKITDASGVHNFDVTGGVVEVLNDKVTVLAD